MPVYNLVTARNLSNELIRQGEPAQLKQVGEHKFEVHLGDQAVGSASGRKWTREQFSFNQGFSSHPKPNWSMLGFSLAAVSLVVTLGLFVVPATPTVSSEISCGSPTNLKQEELSELLTAGVWSDKHRNVQVVKIVDLGGLRQLQLNASCDGETQFGTLDIVANGNDWQIEKWALAK